MEEEQQKIYTVRIVYKSGYTHDFDVTKFKVTPTYSGTEYEWESVDSQNRPLQLGVEEIAAVWLVKEVVKVIEKPVLNQE